jgi:DNA-binding NtrC family response regulator
MSDTKRILVIDDEPTALDLLRRILEMHGYEVVMAANGQEGLEVFRNSPCDLVITDMVMPIKDGLQTILDLRAQSPKLPVIAISGGGTISKERYLAVAGYLERVITIAKPFGIEAIIESVEKLLSEPDSDTPHEDANPDDGDSS